MTDTATPTLTFANVTIYTRGEFFGNISRTDVKEVSITTGVRSAQYENALKVRFKEPRQRTMRGMTLDYRPFLFVLARKDAFEPDDMLLPADASGAQHGRYPSCDPRWESDFLAQLAERGITPLFSSADHTGKQ